MTNSLFDQLAYVCHIKAQVLGILRTLASCQYWWSGIQDLDDFVSWIEWPPWDLYPISHVVGRVLTVPAGDGSIYHDGKIRKASHPFL